MALIFIILFIAGALLYFFGNAKGQDMGRLILFAGFLAIMLATAAPALQKLIN